MKLIVSIIITIILGIVSIIFLILDYSFMISIWTGAKIFFFLDKQIINISVFFLIMFFLSFFITMFWSLIVLLKKGE